MNEQEKFEVTIEAVKSKLRDGAMTTLVNPRHPSSSLAQCVAELGFDVVFVDCETGAIDLERAEDMTRAAHVAGACALLRPEANDDHLIARYLARGVDGMMFPHVETADEAARLVRTVKQHQRGADLLVVIMIESVEAVDRLDKILAVDGVDAIFIGSADLAISMGYAGNGDHPEVIAVAERIARAARAKGRIVGARLNALNAKRLVSAGVTFAYTDANTLMQLGTESFRSTMRGSM